MSNNFSNAITALPTLYGGYRLRLVRGGGIIIEYQAYSDVH